MGSWAKRISLIGLFCLLFIPVLKAQKVAFKTNALYWMAAGTMNLELEFGLGKKTSLALSGLYNPWTFKNDKMMHVGALQPEFKYWFCERFEGHFLGIHAHGAQFFGDFVGLSNKRYDGYLVGAGISWGYDWILSNHWNLETEIGFGVNYTWYKESECLPCLKNVEQKNKTFFSPTRLALTIIYLL